MSDTLFIQFYNSSFLENETALFNGFSDTLSYCQNIGEFIWLEEHEAKVFTFGSNIKTVYVSSNLSIHSDISVIWAEQNPSISFVVGGPCTSIGHDFKMEIPPNILFTTLSVEQYFGIPDYSIEWGLDLKGINNIDNTKNIIFSYSTMTDCYWSNCIFCNCHYFNNRYRNYIEHEVFEKIDFDKMKTIRFIIPAMSLKNLEEFIPKFYFNENIKYDFSIRCDTSIYKEMDRILSGLNRTIPNMKINFGIEMPTNRMLKFMKKGIVVDDIIQTVKVLNKYENIKIFSNSIINWPNLIQQDVEDLKYFVNTVGEIELNSIWKLKCFNGTPAKTIFPNGIEVERFQKYLYVGHIPYLTDEAMRINKEAEILLHQIGNVTWQSEENIL